MSNSFFKHIVYGILLFFLSLSPLKSSPIQAARSVCDYVVGASEPYKTIQAGITKAESDGPVAGKTVCIRNDKEYIEDSITIFQSGTNANPFVIQGHPSNTAKPIIKDTDGYTTAELFEPIFLIKGSYVTIEDVEIARSNGSGIRSSGRETAGQMSAQTGITIKNTIIHHIFTNAVKLYSSNSVIDGNRIYESGISDSPACVSNPNCNYNYSLWSNDPEVVNITQTEGGVIKNNTISHVYGGTISGTRAKNIVLENNTIYDSKRNLVHIDQSSDLVVRNNLIYISQDYSQLGAGNNPPSGLYRLEEYYDDRIGDRDFTRSTSRNITFQNNIIVNTDKGFRYGTCEDKVNNGAVQRIIPPCYFYGVKILNNTIINTLNESLLVVTHDVSQDNEIKNNVFFSRGNTIADIKVTNGVTYAANTWNKSPATSILSATDEVKTDDNFKNMFKMPNLAFDTTLPAGEVNPLWFELKPEFASRGADATTVGPQNGNFRTDPSPTPGGSCLQKNRGDADCNNVMNLADYEQWRKESTGIVSTKTADFDSNTTVNILDFEIWRSNYL